MIPPADLFSACLENDEIANCDYTGVSEKDLAKAKILFPTIATVIGASNRGTVNLNGNFYELGGNSLNSVYTVTKLRDQGYSIGITEFITAKTLADVLRLLKTNVKDNNLKENIDEEQRYFEMLNDSHKEDAIKYIIFYFTHCIRGYHSTYISRITKLDAKLKVGQFLRHFCIYNALHFTCCI